MDRLPTQIQTTYAELLEQLVALEAQRAIGHSGGTFVLKNVKGQDYFYFQHALPRGIVQSYVGRRSPALERVVRRFEAGRAVANAERQNTTRLCAVLRSGGAAATGGAAGRVLAALADAAVFRLGAVLVGTQAFITIGTMLGVRWSGGGMRTDDIDIAGDATLEVAIPDLTADVPKVLDSLEMGFVPVPGFSPLHPSTSFKVRGKALRLDLLTPQRGRRSSPVPIPRFRAAAEPLPHLGYLLAEPQQAALVYGAGVLVNVPSPARFALHKLLVARARPSTQQAKSNKDVEQAARLIEVIGEDRPGDLAVAWKALGPQRTSRVMRSGLTLLQRREPGAYQALRTDLPRNAVG